MSTVIICPVCDTRYEIAATLPPEGRKVRCSKCSHVWQAVAASAAQLAAPPPPPPPSQAVPPQRPPQMAPNPGLAARPEPSAPPPPLNSAMRGFGGLSQPPGQPMAPEPPARSAAEPGEDEANGRHEAWPETPRTNGSLPPSESENWEDEQGFSADMDAAMEDAAFEHAADDWRSRSLAISAPEPIGARAVPLSPSRQQPSRSLAIGWALLGLIVLGILGAFLMAPKQIVAALPGANRLYRMIGMGVNKRGLDIEGVTYNWKTDGGEQSLEVKGDIVNITDNKMDIPVVVFALRDQNGKTLSEWTTIVSADPLDAHAKMPFTAEIQAPPADVKSMQVRFSKGS